MARPRLPAKVIEERGLTHMSKEDIELRKRSEITSPDDAIICPDFLTKQIDKKVFENYAKLIKNLGVWSELDADTLGRYVVAQRQYEKYIKPINAAISCEDYDLVEKLQRQQDRAFKQARSSASDLGMTVTSRCKLVVPVQDDNEIPDL